MCNVCAGADWTVKYIVLLCRLDFRGVIDYVLYSKDLFRVLGLLGPMDESWIIENHVPGFPFTHCPSDHVPLVAELELYLDSSASTLPLTHQHTPHAQPHSLGLGVGAPPPFAQQMAHPFLQAGGGGGGFAPPMSMGSMQMSSMGAQMGSIGSAGRMHPSMQPQPQQQPQNMSLFAGPPFSMAGPPGAGPGGPLGAPSAGAIGQQQGGHSGTGQAGPVGAGAPMPYATGAASSMSHFQHGAAQPPHSHSGAPSAAAPHLLRRP